MQIISSPFHISTLAGPDWPAGGPADPGEHTIMHTIALHRKPERHAAASSGGTA